MENETNYYFLGFCLYHFPFKQLFVNEVSSGLAGQWNPMEWDRAADELTWERLLGLDGSLVFLEHVFWVVSLNTLFIVVFGKGRGAPYLLHFAFLRTYFTYGMAIALCNTLRIFYKNIKIL